ncbi:MAG: NlpC/P60 family protein [Cucumibacter sp.]
MSGDELAEMARSWVGTPYRHQGSAPGIGLDCLGLVRALWRANFCAEPPMVVPAYRPDWRDRISGAALEEAARTLLGALAPEAAGPGDVVLFRFRRHLPAKHCGVLVAPGRFVHAQERVGVVEATLSAWWVRHAAGFFRFPAEPDLNH